MSKHVYGFALLFLPFCVLAQNFESASCAALERKIVEIQTNSTRFPSWNYRTYWPLYAGEPAIGSRVSYTPQVAYRPSDIVLTLLQSWRRQGRCDTYNALSQYSFGLVIHNSNEAFDWNQPFRVYSSMDSVRLKPGETCGEKVPETFLLKLDRVPGLMTKRWEHENDLGFMPRGLRCIPTTRVRFDVTP